MSTFSGEDQFGLLAYAYATLAAYSRMNDNRHYLHDVVAGATIGIAYGLAAHDRIKIRRWQTSRENTARD